MNGAFAVLLVYILNTAIKLSVTNLLVWAVYVAIICVITLLAIILFNIITNRKTTVEAIKFLREQ